MPFLTDRDLRRFWSHVQKLSGCWIWTASKHSRGYGAFHLAGKVRKAHRVSLEIAGRAAPSDLDVDHLCRNPSCVKPEHLEAVTHKVNVLRGTSPSAQHAQQTHCKHGHEFTPDNTSHFDGGRRRCRICTRRRNTAAYHNTKPNQTRTP